MLRIATIIGLVLALWALPAVAEHDHDRRASRGDSLRDGRIVRLAHELERATHHVHRRAEHSAHHGDRREARALRALHVLDERARHFHRQVERGRSAGHTADDFERVQRAFYRAERRLDDLHATRHVQRDFERVERVLHRLERTYAGRHQRAHRHRHASHDVSGWGWRPAFWLSATWGR
jgi:hypothetical protein